MHDVCKDPRRTPLRLKGHRVVLRLPPGRLLVSAVEHPATLAAAAQLQRQGWVLEQLPVDRLGRLDPAAVAQRLAGMRYTAAQGNPLGEVWMRPVPDGDDSPIRVPSSLGAALVICSVATLLFGILPNIILRFSDKLDLTGVLGL